VIDVLAFVSILVPDVSAADPDAATIPEVPPVPAKPADELLDTLKRDVILGSYGRVQVSTDAAGGQGDPTSLVAHGTRLEEDPYLELDLGWQLRTDDGATFRAIVTPALAGPLFHYDGTFDATLALRNLYVQAEDFGVPGLGVWAGSRMYRGDDVYLLDFWPLDSLNTVGGGVSWHSGPDGGGDTSVAAHVGLNRLSADSWQYQQENEPLPGGVGEEWVTTLDRQRTVMSLKGSQVIHLGRLAVRPKVYGEYHTMPAGERIVEDTLTQSLPAEHGWLLGGEVSAFGWAPDSYVHLFYRHATGIAATGELTVPTDGLALDRSVNAAHEDLLALAANHEGGLWGVAAGAYWRGWADADGDPVDFDDGQEWNASIRPSVYPTKYLAIGFEASHQWVFRDSIHPRTGVQGTPEITKLSILPAIQPGRGTFARPQVRLQYTMSLLNPDALSWYAADDTRATRPVQHFVGIGAEWWINSQSYR
jgi:maltoporin